MRDITEKDSFNFRNELNKYLFYWQYFIISVFICLIIGFLYTKYSNEIYTSTAKIKILDKNENNLELPSAEDLFSKSKINLDNEIVVVKSVPIIEEVVRNLNLTTSVNAIGSVQESFAIQYPFKINYKFHVDSIIKNTFKLSINDNGLQIIDEKSDLEYVFKDFNTININHDLPFEITEFNIDQWFKLSNEGYYVFFKTLKETVSSIKNKVTVIPTGKKSDILSLSFNSTIPIYSENVLNEIVDVFNNDGISDRQLIHKRTIDFVNSRYSYLSTELDSIEITKQIFKTDNNLISFTSNAKNSLEQTLKSEQNIFTVENQISLSQMLLSSLKDNNFELLPSNIGVNSLQINSLINNYNSKFLEYKKITSSAGLNNPAVSIIEDFLIKSRLNITYSLESNLNELIKLKNKFSNLFYKYDNDLTNLHEKEKTLRSINRNQEIKESLYLFLLQKREEAQVSYAVTEPSIKVVEYAFTSNSPIFPKKTNILLFALLIGLTIPFIVIFLIFFYDNKISAVSDINFDDLGGSFVGEIPFIEDVNLRIFNSPLDRSEISESSRMIASNLKYLLPKDKNKFIIITTSSIKGEGKTFAALNTALALSSLDKKVLLIGADLRNPQIHNYLKIDKNVPGLSNYLIDSNSGWRESLIKYSDKFPLLDLLISGPLPPNPVGLLTNGNLDKLLEDAINDFDFIIIDTPPTLLVSDTINISYLSDLTLYLTRVGVTDKELLEYISNLSEHGKIKNPGFILNGVGAKSKYGYRYGYGYGYSYNYSYNYGYGYGYGSD